MKKFLLILLILFVFIIIAVSLVSLNLDKIIVKQVAMATGAEVTIESFSFN